MGQYVLRTQEGIVYELSSTTNITITYSGQSTDFQLEDGETVSDHYVNRPVRVAFSGTVSDITSLAAPNLRGTKDYIEGLTALKERGETFSLFFSDNLKSIDNCLFDSLVFTQDSSRGILSTDRGPVSSYRVSFTAKQVRFGQAAQIVSRPSEAFSDTTSDKAEGSGTTENLTGDERSELEQLQDQLIGVFLGEDNGT